MKPRGAQSRVLTAKFESGLRLLSQIAVFLPHLYPPVTPRNVYVQPRPARFDIGSLATRGRRLAPQTMAFVIERAYREGMTDSGVLCACMIQKDADLGGRSQQAKVERWHDVGGTPIHGFGSNRSINPTLPAMISAL